MKTKPHCPSRTDGIPCKNYSQHLSFPFQSSTIQGNKKADPPPQAGEKSPKMGRTPLLLPPPPPPAEGGFPTTPGYGLPQGQPAHALLSVCTVKGTRVNPRIEEGCHSHYNALKTDCEFLPPVKVGGTHLAATHRGGA